MLEDGSQMREILEFQPPLTNVHVRPSSAYQKKSELGPGEQLNRGYHMPVDKQNFRFGEVKRNNEGGVGDCMSQISNGQVLSQSRYSQNHPPQVFVNQPIQLMPNTQGLNPIDLRNKPDSVRNCLTNLADPTHVTERAIPKNHFPSQANENQKIGSNYVFGMPTNILNKKDGRLFSENATVEEIMTRSEVQKPSLLDHNMNIQRTRDEVF
jgi:hypothetical protein